MDTSAGAPAAQESVENAPVVRVTGVSDRIASEGRGGVFVVNCTSRTKDDWSLGLSPFVLGPVPLYGDLGVSLCFENAWQFAKVYAEHVDANGDPTQEYWAWAREGWANAKAVRFPMGRGAVPLYSLWAGQKLDYIAARRVIYAPLYAAAVARTDAFARLRTMFASARCTELWLRDFDGYDETALGMSLERVVHEPRRKMGHAFVLKMLLLGERAWESGPPVIALAAVPARAAPAVAAVAAPVGPTQSFGVLVRSGGLYLLCHCTRAADDASEGAGVWTIPKGMGEAGETPVEAARRELFEETGLRADTLAADAQPLCDYGVGKGARRKVVTVFLWDDPHGDALLTSPVPLRCASLIEGDFVPLALRGRPEVDDYRWCTWEQCAQLAFPSQRFGLFARPEPHK